MSEAVANIRCISEDRVSYGVAFSAHNIILSTDKVAFRLHHVHSTIGRHRSALLMLADATYIRSSSPTS